MLVITTVAAIREWRRSTRDTVGFVPTMGYLHQGHLSLVKQAKAENKTAVVSIFVNPAQFLPHEDFRSYPRDTERDLAMLRAIDTDIVFMPSPDEMYPALFSTWVDVPGIGERLEGKARPGHFRGVATVVAKLFNIVEPSRAYFGQKDAQQCVVIKRMVHDLNMNLEVIICPTVREADGLAMSSRNVYLSPQEREAATVLYKSLLLAKSLYNKGERDAQVIRDGMLALLRTEPLGSIEYVSIADRETLEELEFLDRLAVISLVVKMGRPRLLDNILIP